MINVTEWEGIEAKLLLVENGLPKKRCDYVHSQCVDNFEDHLQMKVTKKVAEDCEKKQNFFTKHPVDFGDLN